MSRRWAWPGLALVLACSTAAPSSEPSEAATPFTCKNPLTLRFIPDTGAAAEQYLCFGFALGALGGKNVRAVLWDPPDAASQFQIHHATLYAVTSDYPEGPVVCDGMPANSVSLHLWTPGGSNLILPEDVALRLPEGTTRFVVEAHAMRMGSGPVEQASVTVCEGAESPAHLAAFMGYDAPIPALSPMHLETATGSCTLGGDVHLWSVWPHMHLLGKEARVALAHGAILSELINVNPWDFYAQKTYALSVDAHSGDLLTTNCTWQNTSSAYVFGGPRTEDEMCDTALIAWPADNAFCR
ncbi:MAG TPA: hypothetical protein VGM29_12410 [Polyangiaceae bacterium]|jgi:hypothetical protein